MYYRPYPEQDGTYESLWLSDTFKASVIKVTQLMQPGQKINRKHNGNDSAAVVFARFDNNTEMQATIRNMSQHLRVIVR